ncbi:hypothetical protein [Actinomadura hibisca]|uniref:hypothetical protein n=1 Tax=Actinomadura hibisca TaxID=68565 RepID=UPI000836E995|nr:hypothetical protein [Actinomadura hibisca]
MTGALVVVAACAWPFYETSTYVKDDRAVARVEGCSKGRSRSCQVTWRTEDGRSGTASLPKGSPGEEVEVRLTPRGGVRLVGDHFFLVSFVFPVATLAAIGGIAVGMRRIGGRARRLAEQLLAAEGGTTLRIQGDVVTRKDGRPVLRSGWSERPSGHRPAELPERRALKEDARPTRAPRADREFMTVADSAGTPVFVVRRRGGDGRAADLCLLAPDGSARAVLHRPSGDLPGGDVVDATGRPAGALVAESLSSFWAFGIRNEHGKRVGALARRGRRDWVLHLEDGSPEILHHVGLAAALNVSWVQNMQ